MSKSRTDYNHLIKLLLIGDSGTTPSSQTAPELIEDVCCLGVGKSCLLLRFSEDSFTNSFITTIGIDFKIKTINVDNKWIRLQIWDTAGQERFRTITSAYYRKATGILLVYDVTDEGSFKNVRNWMQNIRQHANDQVSKILIGNKSDMKDKRVVPREKGEALAKELGIPFIESSAKTGENVTEIFTIISQVVMKKTEDEKNQLGKNSTPSTSSALLSLDSKTASNKTRTGCCST
eukprot:g3553.t1